MFPLTAPSLVSSGIVDEDLNLMHRAASRHGLERVVDYYSKIGLVVTNEKRLRTPPHASHPSASYITSASGQEGKSAKRYLPTLTRRKPTTLP